MKGVNGGITAAASFCGAGGTLFGVNCGLDKVVEDFVDYLVEEVYFAVVALGE